MSVSNWKICVWCLVWIHGDPIVTLNTQQLEQEIAEVQVVGRTILVADPCDDERWSSPKFSRGSSRFAVEASLGVAERVFLLHLSSEGEPLSPLGAFRFCVVTGLFSQFVRACCDKVFQKMQKWLVKWFLVEEQRRKTRIRTRRDATRKWSMHAQFL